MSIEKKILIVDDHPENLLALEVLLKKIDVGVIKATSGNEALAKTIDHDFALALIDVQMPEMNGYETVELMRQVEKTKFLPVIFLSAIYSEDYYKILGIEAGAVDFITKPFQPRVLLGKIKIFLDLYEQKKKLEQEIEQRKQTEISLMEAKLKAEESDRLKTAFLANMSHEIRTPLTSIVGFASLISKIEFPPEKKQEFADYINKSSEGLITIINDILDVAKIEAGQLRIVKEPVNLSALFSGLFNTFKETLKRKSKEHIKLELSIPEDSPHFIITDENRLRQVISNLLSNAAKFTLEGFIEFGYQLKEDVAEFFVNDSGIGIPKEKQSIIFDRFQKLVNDKVHNATGTGLGLSIVKKITEILGGEIQVTSEVDAGSRFAFSLPYNKDDDAHNIEILKEEVQPVTIDWSSKNILIVEDEYPTYVLLETFLKPTKAKIKWAKNGQEAMDAYLHDNNLDVVLMDIKMPVLNGIETYKKLRELNSELPIIAQTAYAMSDEKKRLEEMGFNGYITKPIDKKELMRTLNSVLE